MQRREVPEGFPPSFPVLLCFQEFSHTTWIGRECGLQCPKSRILEVKRFPWLTWNPNTLLNHWHRQLPGAPKSTRRKGRAIWMFFYKRNPLGRKVKSRYWREWTPAGPWEPQTHLGMGTTMSSQSSFSDCARPSVPLIFATLLTIWTTKQCHRDAFCWLFSVQKILLSKFQ